jgi:hypothetical protein
VAHLIIVRFEKLSHSTILHDGKFLLPLQPFSLSIQFFLPSPSHYAILFSSFRFTPPNCAAFALVATKDLKKGDWVGVYIGTITEVNKNKTHKNYLTQCRRKTLFRPQNRYVLFLLFPYLAFSPLSLCHSSLLLHL